MEQLTRPDEDFYTAFEMAAQNHGVDILPTASGHIVGRGKPFVPAQGEAEPPVFDYQMKRFYAATGFVAICVYGMFAADHGAFDVLFHYGGFFLAFIFVVVMVKAVRN